MESVNGTYKFTADIQYVGDDLLPKLKYVI